MGVTTALRRFAAGLPHVLVAEAPGGTATRLAVEQVLRRRGWVAVPGPADADVLAVVGPTGPRWTSYADQLWEQIPHPRVRVHVGNAAEAGTALERAAGLLADRGEASPVIRGHSTRHECDGAGHAERGRPDDQPQGDEHHGGGGMDIPGGVPLADRGPDRDGLALDQLHVPIGPVLPHWPAGLVLHTTLQGDVVQHARVEVVREHGELDDFWNEPWRRAAGGESVGAGEAARRRVAAHLDSLARLLAVAGWPDAALGAGRSRDDVLGGARAEVVGPRVRRLARGLRRSRTLRWLTGGLGVLPEAAAQAAGVTGPAWSASRSAGDVHARWQAWLDAVERSVPALDDTAPLTAVDAGPRGRRDAVGGSSPLLEVLPQLVKSVSRLDLDPSSGMIVHCG